MALPIDFNGTPGDALPTYNAGWARLSGDTGTLVITDVGRVRRGTNASAQYTWSTDLPPSADYWVQADVKIISTTKTERIGIIGRASNSARTFYMLRISTNGSSTAAIQLWKAVGATFTQLGSDYSVTLTGLPTYTLRLEMIGTAIKGYVNGVERISVTDTAITTAGRIGLYQSTDEVVTDTSGVHYDNLTASFAAVDVTASGNPSSVVITAPTGSASAAGGDVTASGDPSVVAVSAPAGSASSGLPLTLLWNFDGANASNSGTTISNAETTTPTVNLVMRNPEGGLPMWQFFSFGLQNPDAADKIVTINVDLTNQEGGNTILSTWSGPYKAPTLTDHTLWSPVARSASAGILTFTIVVPGSSSVYVASMPPNTQAQIESRIAAFSAAYPALIHDDLPSRIAEGGAPYVVDIAPTVTDDLGRTISGKPMLAARFGNDAVGTPMQKPRILLMANRHPGEHHGNFQLWGFLNYWASSTDPLIVKLRNECELWVLFNQATNGIAAGYRRHEPRVGYAPGDDINREWKAGGSLNDIAEQWISVLITDHGAGYDRVKAVIDFHDLSYSTQLIVYYYRTEMANLAAFRAIIDAEFTSELALETTNTDTATDYFVNTVGTAAFTAEVSDQATSLAGFEAVGAGWADIVAAWYDTGLLGAFADGSAAAVTVSAPSGAASATGADVMASGNPASITISVPTGGATIDVQASGASTAVVVSAPSGAISASANASGSVSAVSVSAPTGAASGNDVTVVPNPAFTVAPFPNYSMMVA